MTQSLLEPPTVRAQATPAQRLRNSTAAVRVSLRWLGVRKTLTPEQKTQAAESFGAEGDYLSARKKLLDTRHPAYKEVTAVRGKVVAYWKGCTLPFPEPGIRLIRQQQVSEFNQKLLDLRAELYDAVVHLDRQYGELQSAAQKRLGRLFNPADYPSSLQGLFEIDWDWPSVEPPDYLLQLSPDLYEQEKSRVSARFEEAVQLAEQAFLSEFAKLVAHLTERLDSAGSERKVFRDSAVANLTEFFGRFRSLNVRSNQELDDLVARAQRAVQGIQPQALRDSQALRQQVTAQLSRVQTAVDSMLVDQPRRRIVRSMASGNGAGHQLLVDGRGQVQCLYGELIDLATLGTMSIRRASHVEPDDDGSWWADLAPVGGPRLGPYAKRSEALQAETAWLLRCLLPGETRR
jgi:hypothetical protein